MLKIDVVLELLDEIENPRDLVKIYNEKNYTNSILGTSGKIFKVPKNSITIRKTGEIKKRNFQTDWFGSLGNYGGIKNYEELWSGKSDSLGYPEPIREVPIFLMPKRIRRIWNESLRKAGVPKDDLYWIKWNKDHKTQMKNPWRLSYIRVDFYYPGYNTVVEIDSIRYHNPLLDKARNIFLKNLYNLDVIRFDKDNYTQPELQKLREIFSKDPEEDPIDYSEEILLDMIHSGEGYFRNIDLLREKFREIRKGLRGNSYEVSKDLLQKGCLVKDLDDFKEFMMRWYNCEIKIKD